MDKAYWKKYYEKNKEKIKKRARDWYRDHPERVKARSKINGPIWQKKNMKKTYEYRKRMGIKNPWYKTYWGIIARVKQNPFYVKKGIKNFLTIRDLKFLWNRDKAHLMKNRSIDRINPDGHYELKNCRYLELSENLKLRRFYKLKKGE